MERLATAVVDALTFLELSGDDVVDPDSAIKVMENIGSILQQCNPDERSAIQAAVSRALESERLGRNDDDVIEFFENFMDAIGLQ